MVFEKLSHFDRLDELDWRLALIVQDHLIYIGLRHQEGCHIQAVRLYCEMKGRISRISCLSIRI